MNELIKINSLGCYGDVPTVSGRDILSGNVNMKGKKIYEPITTAL